MQRHCAWLVTPVQGCHVLGGRLLAPVLLLPQEGHHCLHDKHLLLSSLLLKDILSTLLETCTEAGHGQPAHPKL